MTMISFQLALAAIVWFAVLQPLIICEAFRGTLPAFLPRPSTMTTSENARSRSLLVRGGAAVVDDDDEDEYDDEEEEEEVEDEEEEEYDAALAAAAVKAVSKKKAAKAASVKKAVNEKLVQKKVVTKAKKRSLAKMLGIPYIVRACMNPFTVFTMTKAFWGSLFNLNYLKQDSSQELRSALEDKARKGGSSPSRGKRKMKRGQAKTLSDLPQLST